LIIYRTLVANGAVVEVGKDGDNGVVDGGAQVRLSSGLLHLEEDHGG
jgi:hypothetical protein